MEGNIRVISTKKLLPSQRQYLLNAGIAVVEADFISVKLKPFNAEVVHNNLIFTSYNAFKSFLKDGRAGKEYKIFCVGYKTAQAIKAKGYTVTETADYAEELSEIITGRYAKEAFTFFCGNMRCDTLPDAMTKAGINFNEVEAYETALTPQKLNTQANGILFFSPSGVQSYLQENNINNETCFCIGTTTAKALERFTGTIVTANRPSVENVIIKCINHYKNKLSAKSI